ncbi:MAG TPA: hypothetical protein VGU19_04815 [Microvirga sp.]|jgi:hypothetical protein|nr:hypothetical protein [Microvirga sp.]
MKACSLGLVLLCSSLWTLSAQAQQVPRLDIEGTCKAERPLVAGDPNPYENCMRDETDAERELKAMWGSAAAAHRETCAGEAQIGGSPSYVDMLTCLEMAQGSAPAKPRRQRSP